MFFADFISPYDPTIAGRDKEYEHGAPQIPLFWDENGFSPRPFLYTFERYRGKDTNFRWVYKLNKEKENRRYVYLFPKGWKHKALAFNVNLPGEKLILKFQDLLLKDIFLVLTQAVYTYLERIRQEKISFQGRFMQFIYH